MRFSIIIRNNFIRTFVSGQNQGVKSSQPDPLKNVVGLSKLCVESNEQRQVSGTGKYYKNPEYFGYNRISYAQAEVEMENLRNPQPKAPRKMEHSLLLSTHVLDLHLGKPAEDIVVKLYKYEDSLWVKSKELYVTDRDGRIQSFRIVSEDICGTYKLQFETMDYFNRMNLESFYPFVEISFKITSNNHYHVPLLLSAFGFSTYRGS